MRKKRAAIVSGLLVTALLAMAVAVVWSRSGPRVSGPLRHEVYVWQRVWTQPVREAVSKRAANFAEVVVLKAEISWKDKQPQLMRVAVDYETLVKTRQPIGIALRIGPYSGPFATNDAISSFIADTASRLVAEIQSNQIALAELQIDFDCAESKLDGYRLWVGEIQRRVALLPVTITALPSWLDSRAFKRLATVATNYVLQVHSVERPTSFDEPFTLCDPRAASRAVEQAARIGVPFRVALPTYGYVLAFDAGGKFIGLSAEGPRPNWPTNALLREVSSNPVELVGLVQHWTTSRPAVMRGVIWYRLPVATDNHNWNWPTLEAVVKGRNSDAQ